jgi:hypothetical protein
LYLINNISLQKICVIALIQCAMMFSAFGQYNNTIIETSESWESKFTSDYRNGTFVTIGAVNDSNFNIYGWNTLEYSRYDENFSVLNETNYKDSLHQYTGFYGLEYMQYCNYHCGTKSNLSGDTLKSFIIKYDTLGSVIWEKNYYQNEESARSVFMCSNDTLLYVLSNIYRPSTTNEAFAVLTAIDSSGSVLWDLEFNNFNEQACSIKLTSDNGFLLSFSSQTVGGNTKSIIYKLDSLRNIEWSKTLGPSSQNHFLQAFEMPSGNILGVGYSEDLLTSRPKSWLVELDKMNGNILKDTLYNLSSVSSIFGSFSDVVFKSDHFVLISSVNDSTWNPLYKPNIMSLMYDYSINWRYQYDSQSGRDSEGMFNLVEMDNGFYLMTGISYQNDNSNTNDEWFVITDSLGCDDAMCTVGISQNEVQYFDQKIQIWPNPSGSRINLSSQGIDLHNKRYQIINTFGEVVVKGHLSDSSLDVSFLDVGCYFILVQVNDHLLKSKIIVSR